MSNILIAYFSAGGGTRRAAEETGLPRKELYDRALGKK